MFSSIKKSIILFVHLVPDKLLTANLASLKGRLDWWLLNNIKVFDEFWILNLFLHFCATNGPTNSFDYSRKIELVRYKAKANPGAKTTVIEYEYRKRRKGLSVWYGVHYQFNQGFFPSTVVNNQSKWSRIGWSNIGILQLLRIFT